MMKNVLVLLFLAISPLANAQYWQQQVDYKMDIDVDMETYQYQGKQKVVYRNNAPESIDKMFYHLYFNAFQPGSDMDVKLQKIKDADPRMMVNLGTEELPVLKSKISLLKPNEEGFIKIISLTQNGKPLKYHLEGTILEVELYQPIKSGKKAIFEMEYTAQIPNQIRRSGRNNKEGIALSMAQWYPKVVAYDDEGWHAYDYIGREFYADWGNYEVTIHLDKEYTVAGTGYLQNAKELGYGYTLENQQVKNIAEDKLTWKFKAKGIHDFSWAADTTYHHVKHQTKNGPLVHLFYKKTLTAEYKKAWEEVVPQLDRIFDFYQTRVGEYPYKEYSIIQAGDGGMEYAMCTFVNGEKPFRSLIGTIIHEIGHSWFQFLLATNESKHAWMDEGFTTYVSTLLESKMFPSENEFENIYGTYHKMVGYGIEEPLTTQSDAFAYNYTYGVSSYNKGAMFLHQLETIIGKEKVIASLQLYFKDFKFKHPKPMDYIRSAEKVSGIELDWYYRQWITTTNTIDYAVESVLDDEITLVNYEKMPMPLDVEVVFLDGTKQQYHIPLAMMRGCKNTSATILKDWHWVQTNYKIKTNKSVQKVTIDPQYYLADINEENNIWEKKELK